MSKKVCLTNIVYIPALLLLLAPSIYFFGSVLVASMKPSEDCSFVPLFMAFGIIFSVFAAGVLMNLVFSGLYHRTEKRIFAFFSAILDLPASGAGLLIGTSLLTDGTPGIIRAAFLIFGVASGICFIINLSHLLRRN